MGVGVVERLEDVVGVLPAVVLGERWVARLREPWAAVPVPLLLLPLHFLQASQLAMVL